MADGARRRRGATSSKKTAGREKQGPHLYALGWALTLCAGNVVVLIGALAYPIVCGKPSLTESSFTYDGNLEIYVSEQCYDGRCESVRGIRPANPMILCVQPLNQVIN